jgi:hypothetical protein
MSIGASYLGFLGLALVPEAGYPEKFDVFSLVP